MKFTTSKQCVEPCLRQGLQERPILKWLTLLGCLTMYGQAHAVQAPGTLNSMESDALLHLFIIFNFLRVLFYVPGFLKMAKATSNLDTHSLFMWCCWIFANGTTAMVFLVQQGQFTSAVWLNIMNTLMCTIGFGLILYKRVRYSDQPEASSQEGTTQEESTLVPARRTATGIPLEYLRHAA